MLTFAIAIPNFNQSHFISWALESLRHQSAPFCTALMDGGSSDNFEKVVESYSDVITHLESGPDGGQAAAIKKGKESVQGDIVAWLNADDYYFPKALNRVAAVFEKNPDVDVVYGDAVHVTAGGNFLSYFPPIQPFDAKDLTRSCFICQPACFVRRETYERIGGIDETLKYTMDWDLWHRLSLAGAKFKYIREILAAVRYYPGTKTMSGARKRYCEIWRIERKYGRRLVPFSWAGFYRYDLSFKEKRNLLENSFLYLLDRSRRSKKRFSIKRNPRMSQTLYGFHRWEPVIETECIIHLPWYGRRQWRRIFFHIEPFDHRYLININGAPCHSMKVERGRLCVKTPYIKGPYRKIRISRLGGGRWKLLGSFCELEH